MADRGRGTGAGPGDAHDPEVGAAFGRHLLEMMERVTDGFVALDPDWRFVFVNARAGALLERDPSSLLGRRIWDEIAYDAGDPTRAEFERAMATQRPAQFEEHFAATDRWLEKRVFPSADGLSVLITDVTERKRIEQRLRESEGRFRAFVEQASDAVLVLGADATLQYASPAVTRILGHDAEALVGRNAFDFVHPSDRALAAAAMRCAEGGPPPGPTVLELRVRAADGAWRDVEASGRALGAEAGLDGVLVQLRDAGARLEAERAVRESEALFRTLADAAPLGIFRTDVAGRPTYVNQRLTQILGLDAREIMAEGWPSRLHPEDAPTMRQKWEAAVAAGTEFEHEYRLVLSDGATRWVYAKATPLFDPLGAPAGTVGTLVDRTERRRLEQQLLHAQKLDAIGQLSGGVAHDFNNLLTVIQANVELAQAMSGPEPSIELAEAAAAVARAARLTRQLLAFSRRQVLQPTALHLNDVVLDAERLLQRLLGEHIVVESVLAPGLWPVRADAGQMEQVLINLAVNARDAMPDGGTLTIETANVRAAASGQGRDVVRLTVRDTGVGMTDAVRERIFEPFFTTKPPGVGTGLGLAMVYGIVAQSDGSIHVESAPGAGSEFTVTLPRAEPATVASAPAAALAPAGGTERILLAEDEAAVRGVTRRILERAGYTVLEARHGADALLVWREHAGAIDLLLTDVRMPEMGGLELVAALRAERPTLPVVVMSGYADAGAPGGAELFLEKPFSREVLLRCVRRALDEGSESRVASSE